MTRSTLFLTLAAALAVPAVPATPLIAQQGAAAAATTERPDPDPTRFAEEMRVFASFDAKNYVPTRPVVFVGSSSIRFWPTAERFPGVELINRGFGGAHISDVNHYVEETVLKYRPDVVVFYAGDNDIGAGKSNEQVMQDYREFVDAVLAAKPTTQIVYLPIKPSLARWRLWPQMADVNDVIRDYSYGHPNLHYADVATPMLGSDGAPIPGLFVEDGLHMTPAGYDIWTEVVQRTLARVY